MRLIHGDAGNSDHDDCDGDDDYCVNGVADGLNFASANANCRIDT